jgi:hypothetical protein
MAEFACCPSAVRYEACARVLPGTVVTRPSVCYYYTDHGHITTIIANKPMDLICITVITRHCALCVARSLRNRWHWHWPAHFAYLNQNRIWPLNHGIGIWYIVHRDRELSGSGPVAWRSRFLFYFFILRVAR